MQTLYKDGKTCTADDSQVKQMQAAGWNTRAQDQKNQVEKAVAAEKKTAAAAKKAEAKKEAADK